MKLGWCDVCVDVKDLKVSRDFYESLGFRVAEGSYDKSYFVMRQGSARIGRYQGHIERMMLNFRGGDVAANAKALKAKGLVFEDEVAVGEDGSKSLALNDPDGNIIFLDTHPTELEPDYQKKIGVA